MARSDCAAVHLVLRDPYFSPERDNANAFIDFDLVVCSMYDPPKWLLCNSIDIVCRVLYSHFFFPLVVDLLSIKKINFSP